MAAILVSFASLNLSLYSILVRLSCIGFKGSSEATHLRQCLSDLSAFIGIYSHSFIVGDYA